MDKDSDYIRAFLRETRRKYKIPSKNIANHIGISRSSFTQKEMGYTRFHIDEIEAYANYLGFEIRLCLLKDS